MKRIMTLLLCLCMLLSVCFADYGCTYLPIPPNARVPSESMANDVKKAALSGFSFECAESVGYQENINREAFCELVMNLYYALDGKFVEINLDETPFEDTSSYFVIEAYALGIAKGTGKGMFACDSPITREQGATMLSRMLDHFEFDVKTESISSFSDAAKVSEWAVDAMEKMYGCSIIEGTSRDILDPKGNITVEQALSIVWRLYSSLTGKDVLMLEETDEHLLCELGLVSEDDIGKNGNITEREVINILTKITPADREISLKEWYLGDTLAPLDDLSDEDKLLLLNAADIGYGFMEYNEIVNVKLDSDINEYSALVYLTRLVGDTYYDFDKAEVWEYGEKEQTYQSAYIKGIISSPNLDKSELAIERKTFYELLMKTLFAEYSIGGYEGARVSRLVDGLMMRSDEKTEEKPEAIATEIKDAVVTFKDDFSLSWSIPDKYNLNEDVYTTLGCVLEDGTKKKITTWGDVKTELDADDMLYYLMRNYPKKVTAVFASYAKYEEDGTKVYELIMDLPHIEFKELSENITPGVYTTFKNQWVVQQLTLANGEKFENGAYYVLCGYETKYRKAEYNASAVDIFMPYETSDVFAPEKNSSNIGLLSCNDVIRLRKIKLSGNAKEGFEIFITPESETSFQKEEGTIRTYN